MELFSTVAPPRGGAEHLPTVVPAAQAGRLRDVAAFFAAAQGVTAETPLRPITSPRLVIISGERSLPAAPPDPAAASVPEPTQAFAQAVGVPAELVELSPHQSFEESLEQGIQLADAQADRGVDLVLPASLGAGDEEEALALFGLLCTEEPVSVVGFQGVSDQVWSQRVARVRDLMYRARAHRGSAADILRGLASPAMVSLVGFLAQSAVRRTPILLDTTVTCVAACFAQALAPGAKDWMLAGQLTPQAGQLLALRYLGLTPLFALNMPLGMGTGAAAAMPLVRAATSLYALRTVDEAQA